MIKFVTLCFIVAFSVATIHASPHSDYLLKENTTYPMVNGKHEIVIELAIVCDLEFTQVFQYDEEKILNFWTALLWDVHLRFKMLQNVSLSLRVNSIVTLECKEEQQFLERIRLQDGKLPAPKSLSNFESWLFDQALTRNFVGYDIAILATGSGFSDSVGGVANAKHVCNVDVLGKTVDSVLAITLKTGHLPVALVHEISHLLGAYHDMEDDYKKEDCGPFNATDNQFLMAYTGDHKLREYLFSPCSHKSIMKFLATKQADCLRKIVGTTKPLVDTLVPCNKPEVNGGLSFEDQCRIMVNNQTAYVIERENNCLEARCHMDLGAGMFSASRKFDPFEGTKCRDGETEGRCILGSCLPEGSQLVHVASEKCVGNQGPSFINDTAALYSCPNDKLITPHELVWIETAERKQILISMLFSNHSHNETHSKCLGICETTNSLIFKNCTEKSLSLTWIMKTAEMNAILKVANPSNGFVLQHATTRQCLTVLNNGSALGVTMDCSVLSPDQQWKFVKESEHYKNMNCSNSHNFISFASLSSDSPSSYVYPPLFFVVFVVEFYVLFLCK